MPGALTTLNRRSIAPTDPARYYAYGSAPFRFYEAILPPPTTLPIDGGIGVGAGDTQASSGAPAHDDPNYGDYGHAGFNGNTYDPGAEARDQQQQAALIGSWVNPKTGDNSYADAKDAWANLGTGSGGLLREMYDTGKWLDPSSAAYQLYRAGTHEPAYDTGNLITEFDGAGNPLGGGQGLGGALDLLPGPLAPPASPAELDAMWGAGGGAAQDVDYNRKFTWTGDVPEGRAPGEDMDGGQLAAMGTQNPHGWNNAVEQAALPPPPRSAPDNSPWTREEQSLIAAMDAAGNGSADDQQQSDLVGSYWDFQPNDRIDPNANPDTWGQAYAEGGRATASVARDAVDVGKGAAMGGALGALGGPAGIMAGAKSGGLSALAVAAAKRMFPGREDAAALLAQGIMMGALGIPAIVGGAAELTGVGAGRDDMLPALEHDNADGVAKARGGHVFKAPERRKLAAKGDALPGGGFPIRNVSDLHNAIRAVGRAGNPAATKAHIKRRAGALGVPSAIPKAWG